MTEIKKAARGAARLTDLASLPCLDSGSYVKYEGSISKCGDNADWDWGMYLDEHGEWVLMEADGAGCIYNFTQHRYPTSTVPTFRFYFDGSEKPQFEIRPSEFGTKAPFLKPLADKFVGPECGGAGPIWVVRSFVPMEFRTHCKVTSDVKLEGRFKDNDGGGWGHVMYHLYDTPDGLTTFSPDRDFSEIVEKYQNRVLLGEDKTLEKNDLMLKPGCEETVFSGDLRATVTRLSLSLGYTPELSKDLWIRLVFDGKTCVEAPIGTFFGCEYGSTPGCLETALLTSDFIGGFFENRYPMPFFENYSVTLLNKGTKEIQIRSAEIGLNTSLSYDPAAVGYFRSSDYYPKTLNVMGRNSLIAELHGSGQMVYGVLSGYDIASGCEGDVRVFIDGLRSPNVESDGSESWASYGWGFVSPPQCNPFSAYNGIPEVNGTWSELRLTFGDCYNFRTALRFELEHGTQNDGGGCHSGQIFYYGRDEKAVQNEFTVPQEAIIRTGSTAEEVNDRFENGIHENYRKFTVYRSMEETKFTVNLPEKCRGLVLHRVSMQDRGRTAAKVFVDGSEVTEREWFFPDSNTIYSLLDDDFPIPARYFAGKDKAELRIVPQDGNWSECEYKVMIL